MEASSDAAPMIWGLAAVFALVLLNAYFVAAEFALVGARKSRLEALAREGDRKAIRALGAVQHLDQYISATQLGITLASLGLGWIGKPALAELLDRMFAGLPEALGSFGTHAVSATIAFSIITVLHIVLGELVPKSLALLFPEGVSRWIIYPLLGFSWVMHYPITVLNGTANRLLRWAGIKPPTDHARLHSADEIRILVEQSGVGGSLDRSSTRLLEGVFEFSEKTAEEVMSPRTDMTAIEADQVVEDAADIVAEAGRSRYPVYTESLDEIVGVVHAKELLRTLRQAPGTTVRRIMRPPVFVPGTREVEDVLADMKRLKTHLAIVLDEYGGTAGLVTMEDLLEEIVGEILDEYDPVEPLIGAVTDGSATIDGAMTIGDFNARFDAELDDTDYTTLGGFLFGQLGRLPKPGDRVSEATHVFEIISMDGRRVNQVRVLLQ